jgi:hypothetical protein
MNRENNNNNRDRNPFQRNSERRNEYPRANGYGYNNWKNRNPHPLQPQPILPPKEKVLTADDFPALSSSGPASRHVPDKNAWEAPEVTIADRVKDAIAKEEERRMKGQLEEQVREEDMLDVIPLSRWKRPNTVVEKRPMPKDSERLDVIPLSNWMRSSYLAKKRVEDEKQQMADEEEANYRWQISRSMVRRDSREELEREFERHEAEDQAEEEEFVDESQYEREDRR